MSETRAREYLFIGHVCDGEGWHLELVHFFIRLELCFGEHEAQHVAHENVNRKGATVAHKRIAILAYLVALEDGEDFVFSRRKVRVRDDGARDRKSTRLNSSHLV